MRAKQKRGLSLLLIFLLILTGAASARDKRKKKRQRRSPVQANKMIILAGHVRSPYNANEREKTNFANTLGAVPGVKVEMLGTGFVTVTDKNGSFFFFDGPEGPVSLVFTKQGYKSITRTATINRGGGSPPNMTIEMLPSGVQLVDHTPTGLGTVYAAFAPRRVEQSGNSNNLSADTHWYPNLQTVRAAIAAGADPLSLEANPLPNQGRTGRNNNPTSGASSTIMIYPPNAPSRTGFHNTSAPPYWLCFDQTGDTLYVANAARQIQILDAVNGNAVLATLPVENQGLVTDLRLSQDGRWMLASVMASTPGVMVIDTRSRQPLAFLTVDGMASMTPSAVASNPQGDKFYVVLDGQMDMSGQGLLALIDGRTGQTLGSCPVGNKPSGIAFSGDQRFAYVVNSGAGNVTVIDRATLRPLGLLNVGVTPQKIAATPDGTTIFVTNKGSNTVSVIDARMNRVVGNITVGKAPTDIKISPDGKRAYVSNRDDGTISVIDVRAKRTMYVTDAMPKASPIGLAIRP